MDVYLEPGKYVVAVSGGVDSLVLLNMLSQKPGLELVVAHYNHGIRSDSLADQELVAEAAQKYALLFEYGQGHLDSQASEAFAREKRYAFLHAVQANHGARAIITAHHQDDLIETILLALLRGTGRKGLTSLRSTPQIVRPLVDYTKQAILAYANQHNVSWHEDSTNADDRYKRNYLRHAIMPAITQEQRQRIVSIHSHMLEVNDAIDTGLADVHQLLMVEEGVLDRQGFIMLPHAIAREYMAYLLRTYEAHNMTSKTIERLIVAVKAARPGTFFDVDKTINMEISRKNAQIVVRSARNTVA